jgi:purine-binding chemotaxis protein CheW
MSGLFVLAWIGAQQVAFEATSVEAVVDIPLVVPVPLAASHIVGLASIRSQVITVIDCSAAIGGPFVSPTGRAVLTAIDGHRYALRVDRVDDVVAGSVNADVGVPLGPLWGDSAKGVIEVGDRFAIVVDPAKLVAVVPAAIAA